MVHTRSLHLLVMAGLKKNHSTLKEQARFCPCGFSCPFTSPESDVKSEKFTPQLRFHPGQGTQQVIWWSCPTKVHVTVLRSDCPSNPAARPHFGHQPLCHTQTLTAVAPRRFFLPGTAAPTQTREKALVFQDSLHAQQETVTLPTRFTPARV